jgi:hypothetical protein
MEALPVEFPSGQDRAAFIAATRAEQGKTSATRSDQALPVEFSRETDTLLRITPTPVELMGLLTV